MISQGNQKLEQKNHKQVENIVASKDDEITHLKNHSQDLIAYIKKLKREKRSQEEIQEKIHMLALELNFGNIYIGSYIFFPTKVQIKEAKGGVRKKNSYLAIRGCLGSLSLI